MPATTVEALLILTTASDGVPPELRELAQRARLTVVHVSTIYEAAARLAQVRDEGAVRAIFIELTMFTSKVAAAVGIFRRFTTAPVILLPAADGAAAELPELPEGVNCWPDALPSLAQFIQGRAAARDGGEDVGSFVDSAAISEAADGGNVVTSPSATRYDGTGPQPLLSEQEMRALLGPMD